MLLTKTVQRESLLFCLVAGTYYAYRNRCKGCGTSLDASTIERTALVCASCGRHYDIIRAGRCLDTPDLFLEPIPLLAKDGKIKVSLPSSVTNASDPLIQDEVPVHGI